MKSTSAGSDAANASQKSSTEIIQEFTEEEEKNRAAKRRKGNDGVVLTEESEYGERVNWVKKYDATGLVPYYTHISEVPEHLHKYFHQRKRFFSLYSTPPGCLFDEEGWYSVTPELLANQIAERCRCDTILDAFCGVGGNAIAFAKTCQRVIALDVSPTRLALARHNAQIYGVADRIEFILADYISFAKSYQSRLDSSTSKDRRKVDVVFLSPPWGGPAYLSGTMSESLDQEKVLPIPSESSESLEYPSYSLFSIQPIHGTQLFDLTRKITKNIAYYLPRNTRLDEIGVLLSEEGARTAGSPQNPQPPSVIDEKVEVEEEWMGNKLKALTCYFGGLVSGQEAMF
ncbi:S-adenosyl-L-methionine-dependent methyltransferase [Pholiota conissans]|uniref:Trimethylguanosine synthase n=1 Tax=Pholiota conissans TaxID=109636 RepID=A0A9P6CZR0_9AGAR|nr:S-adenosyl-L-methionine-dependent methyltransferase [Pholiota conissans]